MRTIGGALLGTEHRLLCRGGEDLTGVRVYQHDLAPSAVTLRVALSSNPAADAAMERYADGDDRAFDELYEALAPRLYSYGLRIARNDARAEDLLQHTWEMMCRNRGRFVRGSRVMPWAVAILRNRDRDARKRPKVEELSNDGLADAANADNQPDPSECAERKQFDELVRQELRGLPACQRDAVELFYYGGLTQAEIAEVLDATVAAVKSRIQRATETLRCIFRCSDDMDDQ